MLESQFKCHLFSRDCTLKQGHFTFIHKFFFWVLWYLPIICHGFYHVVKNTSCWLVWIQNPTKSTSAANSAVFYILRMELWHLRSFSSNPNGRIPAGVEKFLCISKAFNLALGRISLPVWKFCDYCGRNSSIPLSIKISETFLSEYETYFSKHCRKDSVMLKGNLISDSFR